MTGETPFGDDLSDFDPDAELQAVLNAEKTDSGGKTSEKLNEVISYLEGRGLYDSDVRPGIDWDTLDALVAESPPSSRSVFADRVSEFHHHKYVATSFYIQLLLKGFDPKRTQEELEDQQKTSFFREFIHDFKFTADSTEEELEERKAWLGAAIDFVGAPQELEGLNVDEEEFDVQIDMFKLKHDGPTPSFERHQAAQQLIRSRLMSQYGEHDALDRIASGVAGSVQTFVEHGYTKAGQKIAEIQFKVALDDIVRNQYPEIDIEILTDIAAETIEIFKQ